MREMEKEEKKSTRTTWVGQCEYVMSLFGYLSGSGDFWKYPYLFWKNGGGTFIIVYLTAIIVFSIPVYFIEVTISQYSGKGMYDVWCICPLFSGVCATMFTINVVMLIMFPTIRIWIMSYIRYSFHSVLPWTTCGNSWNTEACVTNGLGRNKTEDANVFLSINITNGYVSLGQNYSYVHGNKVSSEEEFWRYQLLGESSGIEEIGTLKWDLVLYDFLLRGIIVICVIKSVKSIGKVMYVTTAIPILLIIIILIRTLLLPGATEGLIFFLTPDFSKLANKQLWMEAGFGALNTLGIGMGGTLVVGSHGKFKSSVLRSTICACALDVFGSVFTSMLFFSVLGVMAAEQNIPIANAITSGTSVAFVGMTKAFSYLPGSRAWSLIFFTAVFIALLDVLVIIKEVVVDFIMHWVPYCRDRHTLVVLSVFIASFLLSLPYVTQVGPYLFLLTNWYYGSWCTLITTFIECIICMWIFGGDKIDDMLRCMASRPMPSILRFTAAFVSPIMCFLFFAISIGTFKPLTYGDYHFPAAATAFGYCLGILPVLPIPIMMAVNISKMKGPLTKRISSLLIPSSAWGPVDKSANMPSDIVKYDKRSMIHKAYYNATGKHKKGAVKNINVSTDEVACVPLQGV